MKKISLFILMCGFLANCGGGSGGGGTALTPLTEDQKQDVLTVSTSMKDMKSVEKTKTGNPNVDIKANQTAFQGSVSRLSLAGQVDQGEDGSDIDIDTDFDFEASDNRLTKVERHLENTVACEPKFEMTEPTGGFPMQTKFSLEMGNEDCGIYLSSNFDSTIDLNEDTGDSSLSLIFDAAFKTFGEFQEDFDVTEFTMKGSMKGSGKTVENQANGGSFTFTATGNFDGNGVSKAKGPYKFQIIAALNSSISASERDPQTGEYTDLKQSGTERTEVKYIFTDFTAVLVEEGTMNDKGVMVYKYYLNGVEVDQEDPKAMKEFETMASSFGVPGTATTENANDEYASTGVETNNDDFVPSGF